MSLSALGGALTYCGYAKKFEMDMGNLVVNLEGDIVLVVG